MRLPDTHTGQPERPNVHLYAGYDTSGEPLVVFVDRLMAFHSEPGCVSTSGCFETGDSTAMRGGLLRTG